MKLEPPSPKDRDVVGPSVSAPNDPNGFLTYLMVLYAPRKAFSILAEMPMWHSAALLTIAGWSVAFLIAIPVEIHNLGAHRVHFAFTLSSTFFLIATGLLELFARILALWFFPAIFFFFAAVFARGDSRVESAWMLAVNLSVISVIGVIAGGILVDNSLSHSAAGELSPGWEDLFPSLASLGHFSGRLQSALHSVNLVSLWYWIVAAIAFEKTLRFRRVAAIAAAAICLFADALYHAAFYR